MLALIESKNVADGGKSWFTARTVIVVLITLSEKLILGFKIQWGLIEWSAQSQSEELTMQRKHYKLHAVFDTDD